MNYERFKEIVQNNILKYLPENEGSREVIIMPQKKNNGQELDGISITGGGNIVPILYLSFYYDNYLNGSTMDEILKKMAEDYTKAQENSSQFKLEFEFEKIKDHIFVAACNAERNRELLTDIPHELREDLALVYKIHLSFEETGNATIQIKNSHMDLWGIDQPTLMAVAWESMKKKMPVNFMEMGDVLGRLMEVDFQIEEPERNKEPMYVLTNQDQWLGVAYMFDTETMDQIAAELNGNLIILPSSLHEAIVIRETADIDLQDLKDMVGFINKTVVSDEEVLSDEIYRYDAQNHVLSIVDDFGCQQMGMDM